MSRVQLGKSSDFDAVVWHIGLANTHQHLKSKLIICDFVSVRSKMHLLLWNFTMARSPFIFTTWLLFIQFVLGKAPPGCGRQRRFVLLLQDPSAGVVVVHHKVSGWNISRMSSLESVSFTGTSIPTCNIGYDVISYCQSERIAEKLSKMPPLTAWGGISWERLSEDRQILHTYCRHLASRGCRIWRH